MTSIFAGLDTAKQALALNQYALSITQRNTVNVNNPYYTRQDLIFSDPTVPASWITGGVPGVGMQVNRNSYLDRSISRETAELGESSTRYGSLKEIDSIVQGTSGAGLNTAISNFFNAFTELSSNPTDLNLRRQVISQAGMMATEFRRLSNEMQQVQIAADKHVRNGIGEINDLTAKIADLNGRIEQARNIGSDDQYALTDERQRYMEELQNQIGVQFFETESGSYTVTTSQGDALVLGKNSYQLEVGNLVNSSFAGVSLGGKDITDSVTSGAMGGYLQIRDTVVPGYMETLDDLAAGLAQRVNDVHMAGDDLDGQQGQALFSFTTSAPGSTSGASRSLSVTINDPRAIAAAGSGGAVGDNENAKALAAIADEKIFAGGTQTAGDLYASLIYRIGSDERDAETSVTTQQNLLNQLSARRSGETGVDLNEEAVNLIKFQKAYQANSRFVTVINALSEEILNFVGV